VSRHASPQHYPPQYFGLQCPTCGFEVQTMSDQLTVKLRETTGKRRNRRLRDAGQIPAVLYGHGEPSVSLQAPADELEAALRHGAQVLHLQGDVDQQALIRDIQWDWKGQEVLHIDFYRVVKGEKVEATIPIRLKGEAPGVREGGVLNQVLHEVDIVCPVMSLPESFEVSINDLQLNGSISVAELELPEGASLVSEDDEPIVTCNEAVEAPEEEEAPVEGAEPEVIGRKEEDEGEEG
jgi:large subunit ribosomal protein L25